MPSGEVSNVPLGGRLSPTTTNNPFPYATALRSFNVYDSRRVQTLPSDDVRMAPPVPTATQVPLPFAAPLREELVPRCRTVHRTPSGEVAMISGSPTATKRLSAQPIPCKSLRVPLAR